MSHVDLPSASMQRFVKIVCDNGKLCRLKNIKTVNVLPFRMKIMKNVENVFVYTTKVCTIRPIVADDKMKKGRSVL